MSSSSSAAAPAPRFTVPVPALGDAHPGGAVVCTEPHPGVYLLTFTSPPDNRLTSALCGALLRALDVIELSEGADAFAPGVVVTTSGLPKFYSNGLDLARAVREGDAFWEGSLWRLYRRLLAYPLPTVALLNGHAFAGGLMLAMHHDYRVVADPARGYLCLNELDFGAPLKPPMSAVFRLKVPDPRAYRALVLEARRFGGREALDAGLVDALGGLDDGVMPLVEARGLRRRGATGVYGLMKVEMYRECIDLLESHQREEAREKAIVRADEARKAQGRREVAEWRKKAAGAKL